MLETDKAMKRLTEKSYYQPLVTLQQINETTLKSQSHLPDALEYLYPNEGGYSNHYADSGGPTIWGVTQATWERFLGRKVTIPEMKKFTKEMAAEVYNLKYWIRAGLDKVQDKNIAIAIFDQCVNWGPEVGVKFAVQAMGLKQSAPVELTLSELKLLNSMSRMSFITRFAAIAKENYIAHSMWWSKNRAFRKGWVARADRLLTLRHGEKV